MQGFGPGNWWLSWYNGCSNAAFGMCGAWAFDLGLWYSEFYTSLYRELKKDVLLLII